MTPPSFLHHLLSSCGALAGRPVSGSIGSGDAFAAGLVLGPVKGDIASQLPTAVAMAVLKLGIEGDHFLGSKSDIDGILAGTQREVNR